MLWTGERVLPMQQQHDVRDLQAHAARYLWAMRYCVHKTVLDVACGEGYGSWILSWAADRVYGVDISEEAVAEAKYKYSDIIGSRATFKVEDAEALPQLPEFFDVVVSFETIEHLNHPERLVHSVYAGLKPGGLFIASAPENSGSSWHVKDYTAQELSGLLASEFTTAEYFVQDIGREMEIRKGGHAESEHPTHIFVCHR